MQRVLALVVAVLAVASNAQAASIEVIRQYNGSNPEDPLPGDTFTLTVIATANAGETDTGVFGRLVFFGGASFTSLDVQQTPLETTLEPLGTLPWLAGPVTCFGSSSCDMFNQVGLGVNPFPVSNTPLEIATLTFLLGPGVGTLYARWEDTGAFAFDFFGAPVPPDVCIIGFECPIIPEPATGALLALGLAALATAAPRRTR